MFDNTLAMHTGTSKDQIRLNDRQLEVLKDKYEEVSHMLDWHGEDGRYARMTCGMIEELLGNFNHELNEFDWIK